MASKRYVVARAEDLPAGARKIVSVGNREIGVFNIEGSYYALRNNCPHKNGPLCRGRLRPLVVSPGVYQIDYQQEGLVLKCPLAPVGIRLGHRAGAVRRDHAGEDVRGRARRGGSGRVRGVMLLAGRPISRL